MISIDEFNSQKEKYGHQSSWAIWAAPGKRPKDNVGNLKIFETDNINHHLDELNPHIVFVGLNISRKIMEPLGNFHDPRPQSMDYKIRYALADSPYWGAYMTDVIKDFEQKVAGNVMKYLVKNQAFEYENISSFLTELSDLRVKNPHIIAIGNDTYTILSRNLKSFNISKIPHYSTYGGCEKYREKVKSDLNF